jgi:hypothetical protein
MAASCSSKPRRGAPPGNQNARKHGYYSSQYPASAQAEGNQQAIDLQAEIDFIRQSIQRVIALGEPQTYEIKRITQGPTCGGFNGPAAYLLAGEGRLGAFGIMKYNSGRGQIIRGNKTPGRALGSILLPAAGFHPPAGVQ